jgi:membrane protease YdiL (CAAX protease family)
MVSLSLPQSSTFAQTMVFYGALLLIALVYRFVFTLDHPLTYTKVSVKGYATALPMMIVIGEVLGVIGYGLLRNHYIYGHVSLSLIAGCSVIFAFAEEAFFRGLIQQRASLIVNPVLAMLLSVVTYTAVSIDHTTILAPVFALISGIVLSFVYYKKQNILLTFVLNATMKLTYVGLLASFIFIRSRIFY